MVVLIGQQQYIPEQYAFWIGIILIFIGLLLIFFGRRIYMALMGAIGSLIGFIIGFAIGVILGGWLVGFILGIILSIILGIVFQYIARAAIAFICALITFLIVGIFNPIIGIIAAVIVFIIILYFADQVISVVTAIAGAILFTIGFLLTLPELALLGLVFAFILMILGAYKQLSELKYERRYVPTAQPQTVIYAPTPQRSMPPASGVQPTRPVAQQIQSRAPNLCPSCGSKLFYNHKTQRYTCPKCKKLV